MEVENFIQSCCKDAWTQAAVTLTDMSEHISSIGFDLELWTVVFHGEKTLAEVDKVFQAEVKVAEEQAALDKEALKRDLYALLQTRTLTSPENEQASLLFERLERSRLIPSGDSRRSSQSSSSEKVVRSLKQMESLGKGSAGSDFEKVSILIGLSHPNITSLLCYAKNKRECSIVMELMDGDLFRLMQRRLEVDKAVNIMLQIGEGMYYLHEMRIVHQDLKSMNILVKCVKASESEIEYVEVKVADFGMTRTKERSTTYSNQTMNVGTTLWMAPELIKCSMDFESLIDGKALIVQFPFKSDVYSFAMVCYEILSGDIPFSNIFSPNDVEEIVLNGKRPELPDQCPLPLENLIKRCWGQDASQCPSFGDICVELRHLKYLLSRPSALEKFKSKTLPEYTQAELAVATDNWSSDAELHHGANGLMFKGTLSDCIVVAIKKPTKDVT